MLDGLTAVADGEVASDGDGTSHHIVGVSQRDGLNAREVGGVEDDERVGRAKRRSTARDHHTVSLLTDRHAERLDVQLLLLELTTANIHNRSNYFVKNGLSAEAQIPLDRTWSRTHVRGPVHGFVRRLVGDQVAH